jgi:hypothetical protein
MTKQVKEGLGDLAAMAERDHEVQMARADLYKLAKYAIKLHDMLKSVSEAEGIEGWKQAKITTAADDISSVYHAMDYDMKFAESKATKNVLKRTKTTNEVDYAAELSERVNTTLKKKSEITQQSQKNEELDFGKMWSTFTNGPQDNFPRYIKFARKKMFYLPDDGIRKQLKIKFPSIMPVDIERVIKKVQELRADRS